MLSSCQRTVKKFFRLFFVVRKKDGAGHGLPGPAVRRQHVVGFHTHGAGDCQKRMEAVHLHLWQGTAEKGLENTKLG